MSARSSQPELKPTGRDVLVALAILLLAAAVALAVYLPRRQTGQLTVVISAGGEVVQRVPLERFPAQPLTVQSDGYTLVVARTDTASGGAAVYVERSDCPGQDCVHTTPICRSGQSIVCLPAKVTVTLTGAAPDADVVLG